MSPTTNDRAQQGHLYTYQEQKVLALESGTVVRILHFNVDRPWVGHVSIVSAEKLVPQPMKYFNGQIPA